MKINLIPFLIAIIILLFLIKYNTVKILPLPAIKDQIIVSKISTAIAEDLQAKVDLNVTIIPQLQTTINSLDSYSIQNPTKATSVDSLKQTLLAELMNIENSNIDLETLSLSNASVAESSGNTSNFTVSGNKVSGFAVLNTATRAKFLYKKDNFEDDINIMAHKSDAEQTRSADFSRTDTNKVIANHINFDKIVATNDDDSKKALRKNIKFNFYMDKYKSQYVKIPAKSLYSRNTELLSMGKKTVSQHSLEEHKKEFMEIKQNIQNIQNNITQLETINFDKFDKKQKAHYINFKKQISSQAFKAKIHLEKIKKETQILDDASKNIDTEDVQLGIDDAKTIMAENIAMISAIQNSSKTSALLINNAVHDLLLGADPAVIENNLLINSENAELTTKVDPNVTEVLNIIV